MDLIRLTAITRRAVVAAMFIGIAVLFMSSSVDAAPASASVRGELLVLPAHTRVGEVVTVTVRDTDVAVTVLNEAEATDFTGNPYLLPPGAAGEMEIMRVTNSPLADLNGDGLVTESDLIVTGSGASILWLTPETGTFGLLRTATNAAPVPFNVTYRHSLVDTVPVAVTSADDPAGFNLTLKETGAQTGEFVATFKTGETTTSTNSDDPAAAARPVIKTSDGQLINLEYADQSPLTLITNSVLIDTIAPVVTILFPEHGEAVRNVSPFARAKVTDGGSGIEIAEVRFHVDIDRDEVIDEVTEVFIASAPDSTAVNQGWNAGLYVPPIQPDGAVRYFVTATDRAGNVGRSDSDAATANSQDNSFTVDTKAPLPAAAYLGSSYDEENEAILTNQQKRLRVVFTEDVDPDSVEPTRFLVGAGTVASEGVVYEDHPDTVWLTFESLSSVPQTLTVLPGAVKDVPGFPADMYFLDMEDQLGPILHVVTDKAVTNGMISVDVTSEETLGSPPSLTINGVTYSKMIELSPTSWTLDVDASTLTGAASGQGVKNVRIAGLDLKGNAARGGVSPESTTYPNGAVLFEYDTSLKFPAIVPGQGDIASSSNPTITVTYPDEPNEYVGDSHGSVTIISAKLDGIEVTSQMKSSTRTSWTLEPWHLTQGDHDFIVQARDDAGNIHGAKVVRFVVDAPPPTPVPTPELTPVPTVIPIEGPGEEPPFDLEPEATPTPTPEASAVSEASAEPSPTATPVAPTVTETPEATPASTGPTEADIQATVTAMRNEDALEEEENRDVVLAADAGYTVFGCGLPAGNAVAAIGDYAVVGFGLLGLVFLKSRRKSRGEGPVGSPNEGEGTSTGARD